LQRRHVRAKWACFMVDVTGPTEGDGIALREAPRPRRVDEAPDLATGEDERPVERPRDAARLGAGLLERDPRFGIVRV